MSSNIDQFERSLDRYLNPLDFTEDGLGRRIAQQQARRILDRAAAEQGTEGRWKDNQGEYGERKRAKGLPVGVGLRPSKSPMLLPENVLGKPEITPDAITMEHGTGEGPRAVGEYFSVVRPFYGLTDQDAQAVRDECGGAVARKLRG